MIARVEHEMNLNWAEQVPDMFVKAFTEFQNQYAMPGWKITINMDRKRYVTLVATRVFND